MTNYGIIISDFVIFMVIITLSFLLANLFPGKFRESSLNKGGVTRLQTQTIFRRLMQCVYILGMSVLLELGVTALLQTKSLPEKYIPYFAVEELHYDAWLIFWAAASILYLIEHRFRAYYLKNEQTAPISPLLSLILRTVALVGITLWIAKYVLDWHSTHILISATAITAVVGFTLRGIMVDLLAGISLHISHAVIPSQWIQIPRLFIEGEVILTNWRETRLRTNSGHIHIVPNSTLAREHFHNMSWPDKLRRHNLNFIVSHQNDPQDIEEALLQAIEGNPKVVFSPKAPSVTIKAYLEFGIHYQLKVWTQAYYERGPLEKSIYKTAWYEFKKRQIKFLSISPNMVLKRKAEENR